jgi:hypothetical protein
MAKAIAAMSGNRRGVDQDELDDGLTLSQMNQLVHAESQGKSTTKPPELAGASEDIKFDFLEFMNIYSLEKSGKHKGSGMHEPEVSKKA